MIPRGSELSVVKANYFEHAGPSKLRIESWRVPRRLLGPGSRVGIADRQRG